MSLDSSVKREVMGHPIGLFILFFTEMWERFSYYGMRGILTLYIVASATAADPGLGWSSKDGIWLYGWYTMLVYVASIPGGWVADKFLGPKKTVMWGGILLCIGHGVLAIPQDWAFFTGLAFIILGVGGLKPNISTMVGGLYEEGDIRRDSGFTIFYIGINIGAFLASITVGMVAHIYGWHYGFGLAGIGMLLGQAVYMWGQKHLVGVGEFTGGDKATPAAVFQSLNAAYIIIFGTVIGGFWVWWKKKGRESSSLFKMAIGTIIMGLGYVFMMFASKEAASETFGKAAMFWIFLAYLFHTIGELSTSPVSLSFITKLAPLKYASIMMGIFFAASGFGNKLAGSIGESSQLTPYNGDLVYEMDELTPFITKDSMKVRDDNNKEMTIYDYPITQDKNFEIKTSLFLQDGEIKFADYKSKKEVTGLFSLDDERKTELKEYLAEHNVDQENRYHARLQFEKDQDAVKATENKKDDKQYTVTFVVEEQQNEQEYKSFLWLTIFTLSFGLLLILFFSKLIKLTH